MGGEVLVLLAFDVSFSLYANPIQPPASYFDCLTVLCSVVAPPPQFNFKLIAEWVLTYKRCYGTETTTRQQREKQHTHYLHKTDRHHSRLQEVIITNASERESINLQLLLLWSQSKAQPAPALSFESNRVSCSLIRHRASSSPSPATATAAAARPCFSA